MKTRDELRNFIENEKINISNNVLDQSNRQILKAKYKRIFTINNITNSEVIESQLDKLLNMNCSEVDIYANLKFLQLFRSRLIDEGLTLEIAEKILTVVNFNLSSVNEDDDFISDIALRFAELCKMIYDKYGVHSDKYKNYFISLID